MGAILRETALTLAAHSFHNLFNFVDVDDLLRWTGERPELQQTFDQVHGQQLHFLEVIFDTVLQLSVERRQLLDLVQRNQHFFEKVLMLLPQRHLEARCDRAQNLKQLRKPVMCLGLLRDSQEQKHDLLFDRLS